MSMDIEGYQRQDIYNEQTTKKLQSHYYQFEFC